MALSAIYHLTLFCSSDVQHLLAIGKVVVDRILRRSLRSRLIQHSLTLVAVRFCLGLLFLVFESRFSYACITFSSFSFKLYPFSSPNP